MKWNVTKNHSKISLVLVILLVVSVLQIFAEEGDRSLEETLQMLSEDAAMKYVSPISSAFGSNLNGGWFHRAPEAVKFDFNIELGAVAMGTSFPDDAKHFSTTGTFRFNEEEARQILSGQNLPAAVENELVNQLTSQYSNVSISGATVIGSEDDYIKLLLPGGTYTVNGVEWEIEGDEIELPVAGFKDLADLKMLPLVAPQIGLGTVYGTQAVFRYLPSVQLNEDLGKFSYFGFGIQHNPMIWFNKKLPVNVAASFYTQSLKVGDLFKAKTTSFGVNASKKFGYGMLNISPYAGLMFEKATMEVEYDYLVETPAGLVADKINFKLDGENKNRLTLGLSIRILLVNINADYNFGKYNSVTAGVNFAL